MGKKHYPAAFALDKNVLITKLLEDVEEAGVTLWNETGALKVENTASGVRVLIQKRSEDATWIDASRCVVADGVCSRITQVSFPEVWKKRVRLTGAIGLGYLVENLESDWGDNVFALVKNRYGSAYFVPSPARTAEGNIIWKVIGSSADPINKQDYAQKTMDCMMNEGPLSKFFKNIKVLGRTGTAWDIYTPIYEPAVGNTLLVGDVCSMQEVDIQGALPCGFNAGNAIADELDGKPGFQAYTSWWNKAFEFNVSDDPARELAQGFGLFALGAEVLDYWFSIMEHEVLNSFIDHNQLGALLEGRYRDYRQQMERERPDIVEKLDRYFSISAEEAYQGTTEK
jgi:flavin-dependent dehydrogenase